MSDYLKRLAALVLAVGTAAAPPALAADWYTGAETTRSDGDLIVAVDTSLTVSSQGSTFAHVAVTGAPDGHLATTGPRVRVEGSVGRHGRVGSSLTGEHVEGAALIGYEHVWRDAALGGFIGLNARSDDAPRALGNLGAGHVVPGLKAALQFYARPTERLMVGAYGSVSTSHNAYYARLSAGYLVAGGVYLGPEVAILGDDVFDQWRIGAHLTGMQLGSVQLGVSAGYLKDRADGGGVYTTAGVRGGF